MATAPSRVDSAVAGQTTVPPQSAALQTPGASQDEEEGPIAMQNASGRSGAYYLPAGSRSQPVPLLVALHGTGESGTDMIVTFRPLAQARHFAIVAPDSRRLPNGELTREVGDHPEDVTPDLTHTLGCIEWVQTHAGIVVDASHVLIAGSSAPYIGSNRPPFTHIAVLHGGVFPGGIGPRRMPAWFSTAEQDPYRPVALVKQAAADLAAVGFADPSFHAYPGGHELSDAELRDLIGWWLGQ